ncbi:voltage-gated potassium channel [Gigaspora margarita]|uniref:Voltage-gated potassium channel n=1 Tax=Gigaspora margarita TaxID=4874 RepID=A0A8H4EHZ8_GIGMA|nr:voltage-gated potassium channel [Gigaspora margarita]
MSKQQQFTRLPTESDSSFSQTPAIPMQAITPQVPRLNTNASVDAQPHVVHFTSLSPIHRSSISGIVSEEEWPLTEIPQELRETDGDYDSSSANNTEANSMRTDWKRSLFLLLEDPSSSKAAFTVNVFVSFSIILSAVLTTIETIPSFRSTASSVWFNYETTVVFIFTIEYILRLIAHSDSLKQLWKFIKAPLAVIDFIAIAPYYIELAFHHDTTYDFRFTILRLFRLLRVFKAFKYSSTIIMTIEVMIVAVKRSMDALGALFFFMVTSIVLFSTLLYFAERGTWDQEKQQFVNNKGLPSSFDSIPSAFWFVMVTITTTGYGDMVPTTFVGKVIAFPAMMCGILLIALPSIIVGKNFTLVWEAMRQYRRSNANARDQTGNVGTNNEGEYTAGTDLRTSFESTHSYISNMPRGYDSMNDELVANQDVLIEQVRTLLKISQQNQVALERIQQTLEQNGIKFSPEKNSPKINIPEKGATAGTS